MAYADQKRNPAVAIGSVVLVHAALGAALVSGLVVKFAPTEDDDLVVVNVKPLEPPPITPPPPEPRADTPRPSPKSATPIVAPVPLVFRSTTTDFTTTVIETPPPPLPGPVIVSLPEPAPPVAVDLSRALKPRGDQGGWFPQDSYPVAARRAGAEGRVSVSVEVGANGRVTACRVTASSGNGDLDQATCRLATRNGRFEPARDANGAAVPSTTALRNVRWRLEE